MRSLPLILLAAAACAPEVVERPPLPPVDFKSLEAKPGSLARPLPVTATQKERAVARLYAEALGSPGCARLGPLLDEEAHFAFAGARDTEGRDGVVRAHDAVLGRFEDRRFILRRVLLTDAAQAVEWTMTASHKATHKRVSIDGLSLLWTKDDGTIADVHFYVDEAALDAQVGLGPKGLDHVEPAPEPSGAVQTVEQARSRDEAWDAERARSHLQALEDNDEAVFLETMTPDAEVHTTESATPLKGHGAHKIWFQAMRKALGYLATSIENIWGIGPFVVVEYHVLGEQRGPIGWVPAQRDGLVKTSLVDVIEMQDARIARVWRYDNPGQIMGGTR